MSPEREREQPLPALGQAPLPLNPLDPEKPTELEQVKDNTHCADFGKALQSHRTDPYGPQTGNAIRRSELLFT